VSYAVRNIAWLRALSIVAGLFAIPYFLFREVSDWSAIFWQGLFISVNIVNLIDIYVKRKPLQLNEKEKDLHSTVCMDLSSYQLRKLVRAGNWQTIQEGEMLTRLGKPVETLWLLTRGYADVSIGGRTVMVLAENNFIGEMSFLSGEVATADVKAGKQLHCLVWSQEELTVLFAGAPEIASLFRGILSKDIVQKLKLHALEKAASERQSG